MPLAQSQKLHDALQAQGVQAQLVVYPDVGHGFEKNGAPDPATVQAAMKKLEDFIDHTFPSSDRKPVRALKDIKPASDD